MAAALQSCLWHTLTSRLCSTFRTCPSIVEHLQALHVRQAELEAAEQLRIQKREEDEKEERRLRLAQLPRKQPGAAACLGAVLVCDTVAAQSCHQTVLTLSWSATRELKHQHCCLTLAWSVTIAA